MKPKFTDQRLLALNDEDHFVDDGMRRALRDALDPDEVAVAAYGVSAHIWVQAVLTDRSLLLVKGAVRARVTRVPFPLEFVRSPTGTRKGVRVPTPLGKKTLWGSKVDPEARLLLDATRPPARGTETLPATGPLPDPEPPGSPDAAAPTSSADTARLTRRQARRAAGPRPRKPRRRRVRKQWVGFVPSPTIWELVDNCIKCGRPLTDPRSRRARVGTKCILIHGSQQRRIPNPAHARWAEKESAAQAAHIAEKVRADAEYARARAAYDEARAEWVRIRSGR